MTARPPPRRNGWTKRQRQERLHGRLDRVLADEVEDDLVGEAHQQLAAAS